MSIDLEKIESLFRLLEDRIDLMREANRKLQAIKDKADALISYGKLAEAKDVLAERHGAQKGYDRAKEAADGIIDHVRRLTGIDS